MLFCLEGVNFNEQMNKYLWISRNYSRILGSTAAVIKTCNIFSKWCKLFYIRNFVIAPISDAGYDHNFAFKVGVNSLSWLMFRIISLKADRRAKSSNFCFETHYHIKSLFLYSVHTNISILSKISLLKYYSMTQFSLNSRCPDFFSAIAFALERNKQCLFYWFSETL